MVTTLRADGLARAYRGVDALAPLDLTWGPGVHGVLGPNGAGKTTLLRMLAGVLVPTSGRLLVRGAEVRSSRQRAAYRHEVGLLPQEPGWPGEFTAAELAGYVGVVRGLGRRRATVRAREVLDEVGLGDRRDVQIRRMSGGERRRAFLAQALVHDPSVVILDEPTSGLDPVQRLRVRHLLGDLAAHRTVLLSTHLVEDVVRTADTLLVLDSGHAVWSGSPTDLVRRRGGGDAPDGADEAVAAESSAESALLDLLAGAVARERTDPGEAGR